MYKQSYDVLVVGGGHAGVEAALAAARMGAATLLVTHNIDTLGQMSCNPAIGGIGKTHLVREIDAMGGAMARAADQAGIHFRVLNSAKGAAVRATRSQSDRNLYKQAIRSAVESQQNLRVFQQTVSDLIVEPLRSGARSASAANYASGAGDAAGEAPGQDSRKGGAAGEMSGAGGATGEARSRVCGIVTASGLEIKSEAVILATGTFLGGVIHIGGVNHQGGRAGEAPANALAKRLRALPFRVGRLKTGTPPRLDKRTVDFSVMEEQPSDNPRPVMSFSGSPEQHPPQVSCHITYTNAATHAIVENNKHKSAMYSGAINSIGPRYCPSIEDKIHRFADKSEHQVFVEPEGLDSLELYPNGLSTSLPYEAQQEFINSIAGFEQAHITRPGYAIEYDYFDPRDLHKSLQARYVQGLFFAGQINGTTGYEEAAAQGLLAGINAAQYLRRQDPWLPRRDNSYIAVMIDDLIAKGASEPYRLFTSRAEHRLLLREDNADERLTPTAYKLGLVNSTAWRAFELKQESIAHCKLLLQQTRVNPELARDKGLLTKLSPLLKSPVKQSISFAELLRRPELSLQQLRGLDLPALGALARLDPQSIVRLETDIKYAGYIKRQSAQISRMRHSEETELPADFDYAQVKGLSTEARAKLAEQRPHSLGAASRLEGVTPAAVNILAIYLHKLQTKQKSA